MSDPPPIFHEQSGRWPCPTLDLVQLELRLEELLATSQSQDPAAGAVAQQVSPGGDEEVTSADEIVTMLVKTAQEVTSDLRTMALVQANTIHAMVNQQAEFLLSAETIDLYISQIASGTEGL